MKRLIISLACACFSCFCYGQTGIKQALENKYQALKSALYNGNQEEMVVATQDLRTYYDTLDKKTKAAIKQQLLDELIDVFENQDNDSFLRLAEKDLTILPQDDASRFDILTIVADIYVQRGSRELLQATINQMRQSAGSQSYDNLLLINDLQKKANELDAFPRDLDGCWISDICLIDEEMLGRPFLVLGINSTDSKKSAYILKLSGISSEALKRNSGYPLRYDNGFEFSVPSKRFKFSFFSEWNQYGNASVANSLLDSAQETRADFHAIALDRRATIGQTASAEFAGALLATGLEALAGAAAASSYSEENITIGGIMADNNTLDVVLRHNGTKIGTYGYGSTKTLYDEHFRMWRWKKEDNIVFGNAKDCHPLSPYVSQLTTGSELYRIQQDTRFIKAKYSIPTIIGMGLGLYMISKGIDKRPPVSRKDMQYYYGKEEGKMLYKEQGYRKQAVAGVLWVLSGVTVTITVPIVEHRIRMKHRAIAVGNYNLGQYEKLYDLYDKE